MRPPPRLLAAVAALALALPGAGAAGDRIEGELSASSIRLGEAAAAEGALRVLDYRGNEAADGILLRASGEILRVELDTRWANTSVAGTGVSPEHRTTRDDFRNGTFEATAFRANHFAFLAGIPGRPAPHAAWQGAPGRLEASRAGHVEQRDVPTQGHEPRSVPVAGTLQWSATRGTVSFTATGDFHLVLWEVDGRAAGAGRAESYTTGERSDGATSGVLPPSLDTGQVVDRELHLYASNATLSWSFRAGGAFSLHAEGGGVDSPAGLRLADTTGTLRSGGRALDVRRADVAASSAHLERVRADGDRLAFRLDAPAGAVAVDGSPVALAPPAAGAAWEWVVGGLALSAILAALLLWRWSRAGLRRLARAMERGRYAQAVQERVGVRIPPRQAGKASVLHAVSLLALRRAEEADRFLGTLPPSQRPEAPTLAYLLAVARAQQGRHAEAADLLWRCLEAAPGYLAEAVANPALLPLLQGGAEGGR